jgi:hypothetical protein
MGVEREGRESPLWSANARFAACPGVSRRPANGLTLLVQGAYRAGV